MKKRRKNKRQDKIRILLGTSCDKDLGAYALKDTLTVIKETHVCTELYFHEKLSSTHP